MPKLPHLPRRPRPPGEAARLSHWFREWDLAQRLREEMPEEYSQALRSPPVSERPRIRDLFDLVAPFDTNVKVGHIRILHGGMFAETRRPMHIAILDEWPPREIEQDENRNRLEAPPNVIRFSDRLSNETVEKSEEKNYLVAPFGDYHEPATTTEWLTGRDGPLRVLCLWNTRDYPARWLELGWMVDELSEGELADAWEVFRHASTGIPLSDRLRQEVGAPIIHQRDPRLSYQEEEARLFTIVPEYAEYRRRLEEEPGNLIHPNFELALAAGSIGNSQKKPRDYMVLVRSLDIRIWLHRSSAGDNLLAEVFVADGSRRSEALNGATLLDQEGKVLARFADKKAIFPPPPSGSGISLRSATGEMLSWDILSEI